MKITNVKVTVKTRNDVCQTPVEGLGIEEVINRIQKLNAQLAKFWSACDGWAPIEASGLLGQSRLDWQVSLSGTLSLWIRDPADTLTPAELILAWANLGSLIEGAIKLFLSVYYETYKADIENLKKANAFNKKKQAPLSPDGLGLEKLRSYCALRNLLNKGDLALAELVQQRRNAIHAFQDRPIGNGSEFQQSVRGYLQMLRNIIARLPYPDDNYVPTE
jgi:hypothetical protein